MAGFNTGWTGQELRIDKGEMKMRIPSGEFPAKRFRVEAVQSYFGWSSDVWQGSACSRHTHTVTNISPLLLATTVLTSVGIWGVMSVAAG